MSSRPSVLIMQRHLGPVTGFLESFCTVYRLWEGPPIEAQADVRAIVVAGEFALDKDLIERLPNLTHVACFTAGYDGIDVDWCHARGLTVTHAPGVNHEDVADHAVGLILAARRRIVDGDRAVKEGTWILDNRLMTPSLKNQKLGIVGLGDIGQAVAHRAAAIRMTISWWGPREKASPWPRADSLLALAKTSDVLLIACRADDTNCGMISGEIIDAIGPNGLLINVARGQLVDEDALISALQDGRLGQAALDVFLDEPTNPARWANVPNTVLTPHTGGATTEAVQGMLMLLIQNLQAVLKGSPAVTPVRA
ncbi:MAG: hydroxyacid dehydrogenase [Alphaproteobacteria bacterium]|nr:MAG: hydroxyacid dehydrogenase [Alphaproteobacteria bacterium]